MKPYPSQPDRNSEAPSQPQKQPGGGTGEGAQSALDRLKEWERSRAADKGRRRELPG